MSPSRYLLALAGFALAAPLAGQDVSDSDRFALFTGCAPVKLAETWFGPAFFGSGSDREFRPDETASQEHRRMAENRLRAAGIWNDDPYEVWEPFVLGTALDASVAWFTKEVRDPLSGDSKVLQTWELDSWELDPWRPAVNLEAIEDDPSQVAVARDVLSGLLDRFILEYLRVNEGYCP